MDIVDQLHRQVHIESAAIAPQTSRTIETMKLAIEEIEKMCKWDSIETAARDGSRLLVSNGAEFATAEFTNGRWIVSPVGWDGCGDYGSLMDLEFDPTHWCLPTLPRR